MIEKVRFREYKRNQQGNNKSTDLLKYKII